MDVRQILQAKPQNAVYSVTSTNMVYDALQLMAEKNIGAVLVIDADALVGIFSERDYARKGILQGRSSRETPVHEVMTAKLITIEPDQRLEDCMVIMSERHIRHLPVLEKDGTLVGIISINDVVSAIIRNQKVQINSLESYISGSPF
ncbi:MAG: CBS domain-containing protein [Bacteroidetes bacterium]|nr:CBS domain-containing protein [Fibrella sp.]